MFGEEFGWRGLMLRETQKLGFIKAKCIYRNCLGAMAFASYFNGTELSKSSLSGNYYDVLLHHRIITNLCLRKIKNKIDFRCLHVARYD